MMLSGEDKVLNSGCPAHYQSFMDICKDKKNRNSHKKKRKPGGAAALENINTSLILIFFIVT